MSYGEIKCHFFVININPKLSNIQNTNKLLFPQTVLSIHTTSPPPQPPLSKYTLTYCHFSELH